MVISFVWCDCLELQTVTDDLLLIDEGHFGILYVESVQVHHVVFDARHSNVVKALTGFLQRLHGGFRNLGKANVAFLSLFLRLVPDVKLGLLEPEYRGT